MKKMVNWQKTEALIDAFLDSKFDDSHRINLILQFETIVKNIAARFEPSFKEDFIQEGNSGLIKAIEKLKSDPDSKAKFIGYAIKSITHSMIDFRRKYIDKDMIRVEAPPTVADQGEINATKQPRIVFCSTMTTSPETTVDYFDQKASPVHYWSTSTFPNIEVSYEVDKWSPKRIGLTAEDVEIWDLYCDGYKMREIGLIVGKPVLVIRKTIKSVTAQFRRLYK